MPTEPSKIRPYYIDNLITEYHGHTPDVLKEMPPESVHCIVTSIPYWGLRDYGIEPQIWDAQEGCGSIGVRRTWEHKWGDEYLGDTRVDNFKDWGNKGSGIDAPHIKRSQGQFCQICGAWRGSLGLEPTPELYIQHIVQIWRELKRVLRKDGACWLNIGDSYAGSWGDSGNRPERTNINQGQRERKTKHFTREGHPRDPSPPTIQAIKKSKFNLKPKDLVMIPARIALALQADGWWLRSDIIWAKPNPMPESVTDRPTNSYEHIFLLTKSAKYFYDADAVREKTTTYDSSIRDQDNTKLNNTPGRTRMGGLVTNQYHNRNLRNVWTIATEPTPEAHFATFPTKLAETCIKAGTSGKGCCPECGAPMVRIIEKGFTEHTGKTNSKYDPKRKDHGAGRLALLRQAARERGEEYNNQSKTLGWMPSCECGKLQPFVVPCTVLDPFSGSGKALIVAKKLGRKAIGIDLKQEYLDMPLDKLAQERLF